jgi:hypothetical protein
MSDIARCCVCALTFTHSDGPQEDLLQYWNSGYLLQLAHICAAALPPLSQLRICAAALDVCRSSADITSNKIVTVVGQTDIRAHTESGAHAESGAKEVHL